MSNSKDFKLHIPMELVKGTKQGPDGQEDYWNIKGIASTDDKDLQGETVVQDGLDISALKAGRGLFNWDHNKGPENILGQIEDADFVKHNGKEALQVNGYLFKDVERSQAFRNILKSLKKGSGPRVHMSIEGKIHARDPMNSKKINKASISRVALTLDPVNPHTFTELCKSLTTPIEPEVSFESNQVFESIKETVEIGKVQLEKLIEVAQKALSAGVGHSKAPTARTGGEAMQQESMESDVKRVTYKERKKKSNKEMVKSIIEGLREAHPNHDPLELAGWVVEAFLEKIDKES